MTSIRIIGGWYGEALLGGHYAVSLAGQEIVRTHFGDFSTGKRGLLFTRCTDVGGFRFAGQSTLGSEGNIEFVPPNPVPVQLGPSYGENVVLYKRDGTLVQSVQADGVAGLRYEDEAGNIVTGDASHLSADHLVADYTKLYGITIGSNQNGPGAVVQLDGVLRLLEPGICQFIRVNTDGTNFAISIVKLKENQCVLFWLTKDELAKLPLLNQPVPPPKPAPVPAPVPKPKPTPTPQPKGPVMFYVDVTQPLLTGAKGEAVDNGDGTISVKTDQGYLSVDSSGNVKFQPSVGPDEKFIKGANALINVNTFAGTKISLLPYEEK